MVQKMTIQSSYSLIENKIIKEKNGIKITYDFERLIGFGLRGKVYLVSSKQKEYKSKAAKILVSQIENFKQFATEEFQIGFLFPNKTRGLMLHPKALLFGNYHPESRENIEVALIVMHLYDCSLSRRLNEMEPHDDVEAVCQLSEGLTYLHSKDIVHCDIHKGNVFFDKKKNRYDLADFGSSQIKGKLRNKVFTFEKLRRGDIHEFLSLVRFIFNKASYKFAPDVTCLLERGYSKPIAVQIFQFLDNKNNRNLSADEIRRFFNQIDEMMNLKSMQAA